MAGKTPFIDKANALTAYEESKQWLRRYFEPVDELYRIARNKPSPKLPAELPKVTDGTTSAIVQETPKRVVQQIPNGLVECKDYPEYAKMADIVLRDELIPMAHIGGSYLQKSWGMLNGALTVGRSTSYTFLTHHNGKVYTDFKKLWIKDVITEKGKAFTPDSNYRFIHAWYQKTDLKAIINKEKALKEKNSKYQSEWDLQKLADFMEGSPTAKTAEYQTPAEAERGGDSGGYHMIHVFQKGIGAEFYSMDTKGNILRTKVNKDPRGNDPLNDLYCNIDESNPLGIGVVERSGGVQNLMDQSLQMFSFQNVLGQAPPMKKWGNVNTASLKFMPNAIWDMGAPRTSGNDVEPYTPNNAYITSFVNNYQLLQSKIYNLNNSQDTSIGATNGNAGQSKTQAGVNAQMERLGVSDNYLRKQYEEWFAGQSETALNIYFSEMTGKQTIALDKADLKEFAKSPAMQYVEGNKLTIPYKEINDVVFHFNVNSSSSEVKENSENIEKLTILMEKAAQVPVPEIQQKVPALFKLIVKEIGAEGTEDLFPEDQTDEMGNPIDQQQPQITPEQVQQMIQESLGQVMEELKSTQKPQEPPELQMIKALGVKFDKLPEETRNTILEQLGLPSDGDDPIAFDQSMQAFNALGTAESQQQQAETAQLQAQQQTQGQEQAPTDDPNRPLDESESQIAMELMNRGFNEDDVEQAIVMLRQGMQAEQIMAILAQKQGAVA